MTTINLYEDNAGQLYLVNDETDEPVRFLGTDYNATSFVADAAGWENWDAEWSDPAYENCMTYDAMRDVDPELIATWTDGRVTVTTTNYHFSDARLDYLLAGTSQIDVDEVRAGFNGREYLGLPTRGA